MTTRCLALLAVLAACGCGSGTGKLVGKVTCRDQVVAYGSVVVIGSDGLAHPGTIQPDGSYEVAGLPVGEATVCVTSPPPAGVAADTSAKRPLADAMRAERGEDSLGVAPEDVRKAWHAIPDRYSDPKKSGLRFTIRGGANAWDIQLD